jgi:phosphoribosylglycinamide formyltransferase-1
VPILPNDTLTTLEARVHACEHQLYPQVVKQLMTAFEKKEQI